MNMTEEKESGECITRRNMLVTSSHAPDVQFYDNNGNRIENIL